MQTTSAPYLQDKVCQHTTYLWHGIIYGNVMQLTVYLCQGAIYMIVFVNMQHC